MQTRIYLVWKQLHFQHVNSVLLGKFCSIFKTPAFSIINLALFVMFSLVPHIMTSYLVIRAFIAIFLINCEAVCWA